MGATACSEGSSARHTLHMALVFHVFIIVMCMSTYEYDICGHPCVHAPVCMRVCVCLSVCLSFFLPVCLPVCQHACVVCMWRFRKQLCGAGSLLLPLWESNSDHQACTVCGFIC